MDLSRLEKVADFEWRISPHKGMRVPAVLFANETLLRDMDEKVYDQVTNVARLPGIQKASYAMPDAHWGYGFPIGGVAAFDGNESGIVSAGGVGFDISCGVRTLHTGLTLEDLEPVKSGLADALYRKIPAGVGSKGEIHLDIESLDLMLEGGARWAVKQGYGRSEDLERIEELGRMGGADAGCVSERAKKRQQRQMGTLGSGNHYLEIQVVDTLYDRILAQQFGLEEHQIKISIHCGSRGLGHQIGTEFLKSMVETAPEHGLSLPDRELACAPLNSKLGQEYLCAMGAAINCALANRQILTHLVREVFSDFFPYAELDLFYDVSHNTCKLEDHDCNGKPKQLFVHRKGATRAFGPGHADLPEDFQLSGQPVLIGGTMGTASHILAGMENSASTAFSSSCHGAGRSMSRHKAKKRWRGKEVVRELAGRGIIIRSTSFRGVAEEAPGAYKDVDAVVEVAHLAGLSRKVAKLRPLIVIKG